MTNISNKCLNNFQTNKDPEIGKAIADAASILVKKLKPDRQLSGEQMDALAAQNVQCQPDQAAQPDSCENNR